MPIEVPTDTDWGELEERLAIALPPDYKDFLALYGYLVPGRIAGCPDCRSKIPGSSALSAISILLTLFRTGATEGAERILNIVTAGKIGENDGGLPEIRFINQLDVRLNIPDIKSIAANPRF